MCGLSGTLSSSLSLCRNSFFFVVVVVVVVSFSEDGVSRGMAKPHHSSRAAVPPPQRASSGGGEKKTCINEKCKHRNDANIRWKISKGEKILENPIRKGRLESLTSTTPGVQERDTTTARPRDVFLRGRTRRRRRGTLPSGEASRDAVFGNI